GMRQREDVLSGGSYLSSNDLRPHFGLGDATDAGTAEIHWPDGVKENVKLPAVDRIYTVTEGQGITGALCGGKPCADAGAANSPTPKPAAHQAAGPAKTSGTVHSIPDQR
ncbi:MAG: ASPIC/UnbV domain-containing protein, partial [Terracidiphilus sp.]